MSKKSRTDMFSMACLTGFAVGGFNPLDLDQDLLDSNLNMETGDVPVHHKHTDERDYVPTTRGAKRHTTWTHVADLGVEMDDPEMGRNEDSDVEGDSNLGVMIDNKFYTWDELDLAAPLIAQKLGVTIDDTDSKDEDSLVELDVVDDYEDDLRIGLKASDASRVTRKAGRKITKGKSTEMSRRDYRAFGPNTRNRLLRGSQWAKWGTKFGQGATPHRGAALTRGRKLRVRDQYNVPGLEFFDNEEVEVSRQIFSLMSDEVEALVEAGMMPDEIGLLDYHAEASDMESEEWSQYEYEMWWNAQNNWRSTEDRARADRRWAREIGRQVDINETLRTIDPDRQVDHQMILGKLVYDDALADYYFDDHRSDNRGWRQKMDRDDVYDDSYMSIYDDSESDGANTNLDIELVHDFDDWDEYDSAPRVFRGGYVPPTPEEIEEAHMDFLERKYAAPLLKEHRSHGWCEVPTTHFRAADRMSEKLGITCEESYRRLQIGEIKYRARRQERLFLARDRYDALAHNEDWTDTSDEASPRLTVIRIPNFINENELVALVESGMDPEEAIGLLEDTNLRQDDEQYHDMAAKRALRGTTIAHTRAGQRPAEQSANWNNHGMSEPRHANA